MAKIRVRDASYHVLDHEPNTGEVFSERGARYQLRASTHASRYKLSAARSLLGRKLERLKAIIETGDSSFTRCQVRKTIFAQ